VTNRVPVVPNPSSEDIQRQQECLKKNCAIQIDPAEQQNCSASCAIDTFWSYGGKKSGNSDTEKNSTIFISDGGESILASSTMHLSLFVCMLMLWGSCAFLMI
jgi:hypothetical protein